MKYIKKFESIGFQIGDLVVLKKKLFTDRLQNCLENSVGEIKDMFNNFFVRIEYDENHAKDTLSLYGSQNHLSLTVNDIRPATVEEIRKYEIEKETNKYNL